MRKLNQWMLAAILTLCGATLLNSCYDSIPVNHTPSSSGSWSLDKERDASIQPGDDFFMHAIGTWWKNTTLGVDDEGFPVSVTGLLFDVNDKVEVMKQKVSDAGLMAMYAHSKNRTTDLTGNQATIAAAKKLVNDASTKEELWQAMGKLIVQGFQSPLLVGNLARNGRTILLFEVTDGQSFSSAFTSNSESSDTYTYNDGTSSLKKLSANERQKLLSNPRLAKALAPIAHGSGTRGISSEWPILEGVCKGMGLTNLDDAYLLTEDIAKIASDEPFDNRPLVALAALQNADLDAQKEYLLGCIDDDRLLFDRDFFIETIKIDPDTISGLDATLLGQVSDTYLKYYCSYAFAKQYVTDEMRQRGIAYTKELIETFRQRIEDNTWLSSGSKANVREKLDAMAINVAYPDWREEGLPDFTQTKSFLDDVLAMRRAHVAIAISLMSKPIAETSFHILLTSINYLWEVNAFYAPMFNSMNILPVWLMSPFYEKNAPDAYNYATLSVFGHEITHGFDTNGTKYDKKGDAYTDGNSLWATAADEQQFNTRAKALADYYSSFKLMDGLYANGDTTLAENIADLGGLEIAFQAFNKHLQQQGVTGDQLLLQQQRFFYAYAHLYQAKYTDAHIRYCYNNDNHSLPKERVNGVVSNMDSWYDLFSVQSGQQLYRKPDERIHIW